MGVHDHNNTQEEAVNNFLAVLSTPVPKCPPPCIAFSKLTISIPAFYNHDLFRKLPYLRLILALMNNVR